MHTASGWEEGGVYRRAHDKAIAKSYARCITQKQEDDLYAVHFQHELNRIIAKGEKYEALKARGREERKLAREQRFKVEEEETMVKSAFDAEVSARIDSELEVLLKIAEQEQEAFMDPELDDGYTRPRRFKNSKLRNSTK